LKPFAPDSLALSSAREIALADGQKSDWYQVSEAKRHKRIFLIKLESIDDVSLAEHLVGREVWVREDSLEPLREREYFHHEVIGFDVFDLQSNYLGKITRMWFKAGGDLYVVSTAKKEHLIPATKEIVEGVDLRNRRMIVDLPEGLLEL